MSMYKKLTPQQCAEIIKQLLAPTELERLAADQLLFTLSTDDQAAGVLQGSIALIEGREAFIPALVSYWAGASLESYNARMASWPERTGSVQSAWLSPYDDRFPYERHPAAKHALLLGILHVITHALRAEAVVALPQLLACLSHPEPVCESAVSEALLSMGPAARSALPALLAYMRQKGAYQYPNHEALAVAAIIGHDEDEAVMIAKELAADCRLAESYCPIFDALEKPVPRVVGILLDMLRSESVLSRPSVVRALLPCAARLARRADHLLREVRLAALPLAGDTTAVLREAAALALGSVCDPDQDMPLLIALSQDEDWAVRWAMHDSAARIVQPSSELVLATAVDLGNYDGYDGYPHYAALETLIRWGKQSTPAIETIAAWLTGLIDEGGWGESEMERAVELLEAMGDKSKLLLPVMQRLYETLCGDTENGANEEDEIDDALADSDANFGAGLLNEFNQEMEETNAAFDEISRAGEALIVRLGIEEAAEDDGPSAPGSAERLLALITRLSAEQADS